MRKLKHRLNPEPNHLFITCDGLEISFGRMNRLASAGCGMIRRSTSLHPGDKVGILMSNGMPFVATLLALMRMRLVAVLLNSRLTASELRWQLKNTDCRLLICDATTSAQADALGFDRLELRERNFNESSSEFDDYGSMVFADDFAIVHTSGTSGRPKATILTFGNIYSSALASRGKLGRLASDRWLCVLPLYHLGGLSIILRSLIYGTAVDLMPAAPFDAEAVNRQLSDHPITLVSLVPTMLQRLLDAKTRPWNPSLRLILLGGEAPSPELLERCIAEKLPIATSYGLTETASQAATAMPDLVFRKPGTVGKPLEGTQVRIVDEGGVDAAPKVPGEALVSSGAVMRGYYKDPAATAEALQDGWLHTGDIGYLDEDGDLFILQRREDLIVSGGENIYPAEVEAALRKHPAVAEAVVLGLADANWGQAVAAVVELRAGHSASADDIVAFSRRRLAGYKIPRRIAFLPALPRTASGKVQRREARKVFPDAHQRDA
ncbi:MAG: o-succinylbenzoate--CoA ligase [Chloroflexi bacterium]|nr:o-succinylbenzoate--CoA ligase [Chloroflexota bacterium]